MQSNQIKQLQPQVMNYQELTIRPNRHIIRHTSENEQFHPRQARVERQPRLSEPKGKMGLIKINRSKLPTDFFQKKENRRISEQKIYFPQQYTEPILHPRKIQSERHIYSPQKTSFFGFLEEKRSENILKINAPLKFLNRKFETRQETKRDFFAGEIPRKITNTSKTSKRQLLQLFQPTFDDHLTQMLNDSSRLHALRTTPKKDLTPLSRDPSFLDPEKMEDFKFISARKQTTKQATKAVNVSVIDNDKTESMNITFYNAKSNSLPPINRQNL